MPYADVNGLHTYYEVEGQGRPTIVLHGGLGSSSLFVPARAELAKGRKVIAVDLQGTAAPPTSIGRSTPGPWPATSSR